MAWETAFYEGYTPANQAHDVRLQTPNARLTQRWCSLTQPPQLFRPLALVVNSVPPSAPGMRLSLEAPFIMMHGGSRGGLRRSTSDAAAEDGDVSTEETVPAWDDGYWLRLATRKLAVKGLPRRRSNTAGQQQPPVGLEAVARDLAAWACAARFARMEIDTTVPFPTPQPIPLFQQRGVLYTQPAGARGYHSHQHTSEDGGQALVDALAPFCGGDEGLCCRLLAPERVLLERGLPEAGANAAM